MIRERWKRAFRSCHVSQGQAALFSDSQLEWRWWGDPGSADVRTSGQNSPSPSPFPTSVTPREAARALEPLAEITGPRRSCDVASRRPT